jgi:hypothetical protein
MKRILLVLLVFIALVTMANAAVFYRCIDSSGNKIITDNPPQDAKCESKDEERESTLRESQQIGTYSNPRVTTDSTLPRDGMFYVDAKPVLALKATLTEYWVNPHVGQGSLQVFAPVMPILPGQGNVSTRLLVPINNKLRANAQTSH